MEYDSPSVLVRFLTHSKLIPQYQLYVTVNSTNSHRTVYLVPFISRGFHPKIDYPLAYDT